MSKLTRLTRPTKQHIKILADQLRDTENWLTRNELKDILLTFDPDVIISVNLLSIHPQLHIILRDLLNIFIKKDKTPTKPIGALFVIDVIVNNRFYKKRFKLIIEHRVVINRRLGKAVIRVYDFTHFDDTIGWIFHECKNWDTMKEVESFTSQFHKDIIIHHNIYRNFDHLRIHFRDTKKISDFEIFKAMDNAFKMPELLNYMTKEQRDKMWENFSDNKYNILIREKYSFKK